MVESKPIKVWDLPTRLFHWGLVISVLYSWFSVTVLEDMQQHFYAGYTVLTLLLFRVFWGFVGSSTSRFTDFVRGPKTVWAYLQGRSLQSYSGHNPLGALSVLAMLLVLLVQAVLGLFSTDDYFYGPLSGLVGDETRAYLSSLHLSNVNLIYALLSLHVLAVLFYQFVKKQPLVQAMLNGKKPNTVGNNKSFKPTHIWLALLSIMISVAVVYYLATAYTDQIPSGEFDYY